jgi:urease accessory protein
MSDFFWQGLVHPLLMPAHLIVLIALGLLAGQQGGAQLKGVLPVFMATVFGGVGLTLLQAWRLDFESWLLVLALIMGVLIILRLQLSVWLLVVLAIPAALLVGLDSAAPRIPGLRGVKVYALLAGSALSASLVVIVSSLPGLLLRQVLEGIPVRVLGAWITAGAALVLALKISNVSL